MKADSVLQALYLAGSRQAQRRRRTQSQATEDAEEGEPAEQSEDSDSEASNGHALQDALREGSEDDMDPDEMTYEVR